MFVLNIGIKLDSKSSVVGEVRLTTKAGLTLDPIPAEIEAVVL